MSRSPSKPPAATSTDAASAVDRETLSPPAQQPSRLKTVWVGGHFDPAVALALKTLALQEGTTVQALIGRAINDLLERHGRGRPASETVLPRGGAAQRRTPSRD